MRHEDFIKGVKKNAGKAVKGQGDFESLYEEDAGELYDLQDRVENSMMGAAYGYARDVKEFLNTKVSPDEFEDAMDFIKEYVVNNDIGEDIMTHLRPSLKEV